MSHTLTGLSSAEIAPQSCSSIPEKRKHEFDEHTYPTFRPTFSQQRKQAAKQPLSRKNKLSITAAKESSNYCSRTSIIIYFAYSVDSLEFDVTCVDF